MVPRGRLFYDNGNYVVKVGDWYDQIDKQRFSELIEDEFNLTPDKLCFEHDENNES